MVGTLFVPDDDDEFGQTSSEDDIVKNDDDDFGSSSSEDDKSKVASKNVE